ncbi:MAG: hypothetical protein CMH63_01465 [Nanoarchaeota archaeon]|nr:hypothetical protein [Nanoarchaeota archaeon]|tara:strand:+ start:71915 stop:72523 length:609 start_codon:yes stop_codon:yes gene_type:complete
MSKAKVIGSLALSALELIPTGSALAQSKFSGSVGLGGYFPSTEVMGKGGIPFGVDLRGDLGRKRLGVWGGLAWFGKTKKNRSEYRYRGLGDGETRGSHLLRMSGGIRVGSPLSHLCFGAFGGEQDNYFETRDLRWGSYEIDREHDFSTFYGLTGGFSVGGKFKEGDPYGLFLRGEFDYLLHKMYDEPVWGVKFSAGVNFTSP